MMVNISWNCRTVTTVALRLMDESRVCGLCMWLASIRYITECTLVVRWLSLSVHQHGCYVDVTGRLGFHSVPWRWSLVHFPLQRRQFSSADDVRRYSSRSATHGYLLTCLLEVEDDEQCSWSAVDAHILLMSVSEDVDRWCFDDRLQ